MSDHVRLQPLTPYRIIEPQGPGKARILYRSDRAEAVAVAARLGGFVECYVYGIGWQHINKVKEASE